jgi:hypothetical protein
VLPFSIRVGVYEPSYRDKKVVGVFGKTFVHRFNESCLSWGYEHADKHVDVARYIYTCLVFSIYFCLLKRLCDVSPLCLNPVSAVWLG